ncbi:MAG TPA: LysR family transcriptional regulator [Pseudomonadales bacterium]|nr:LysR family transcriptional regulator [Pseudomonadales bacterium]HND13981.1 LysR family transcriptional regulator [Pseudomonadales bacterium]
MLELDGIREFVMASRYGSITQAADRLGRSKSHVSKQIKALEQRLGVFLFNRNARNLQLTEIGESCYLQCAAALSDLEHAIDATVAANELPHGHLKVQIVAAIGEITLAGIFSEFATRYPELKLHLNFESQPTQQISEDHDLLITRGSLRDSSLIAHTLGKSDFGLYASPEYFERFGVPASREDLMRHRCLVDESGYWWFGEDAKAIKVKVNGHLSGNRGSLLLRYALRGLGITQQSSHPMCNLVRQQKLVAVPGGWSRWSVTWHALSRTRTSAVPKIQVLVQFLKECFAQPDKINSL